MADVRWLKKKVSLLNVEVKNHDQHFAGTIPTQASVAAQGLNLMIQGDTAVTRDGNKVKSIALDLKLQLHLASADETVRLLVMYAPVSNGQTPLLSEMVEAVADIRSFRNLLNTHSYQTLVDETFILDQVSNQTIMWKKHLDLSNHVKFNGAAAAFAQCESGLIVSFLYNTEGTPATTFDFDSRFRYVDN